MAKLELDNSGLENLDLKSIIKLHEIFSKKGWTTHFGQEKIHKKFCILLSSLSQEERDLILELCTRYEWITIGQYAPLINKIFEQLKRDLLKVPTKIYLFPIKKLEDDKKTKSADSLLYMFKSLVDVLPEPFDEIEYVWLSNYKDLNDKELQLADGEALILIDDYLGSGDTVKETVSHALNNTTISKDNLFVVSIAAHKMAIKLLQDASIIHSIGLEHNKGISDFYVHPDLNQKIELMERIEKRVTTNKKLKFGYNNCEGLITMIRTPNNTFPVFWMDHTKSGKKVTAPFLRFKNNSK
jgi:hypothetical protein